jgi:C4-type Zn-finger protein
MCQTCDACGYRTTEVKPGGSIGPKGKRHTLALVPGNESDWQRDVVRLAICSPCARYMIVFIQCITFIW